MLHTIYSNAVQWNNIIAIHFGLIKKCVRARIEFNILKNECVHLRQNYGNYPLGAADLLGLGAFCGFHGDAVTARLKL